MEPGRKMSGVVGKTVVMYTLETLQLSVRMPFCFPFGVYTSSTHHFQHKFLTKFCPEQQIIKLTEVAEMFKNLITLPSYFGVAV